MWGPKGCTAKLGSGNDKVKPKLSCMIQWEWTGSWQIATGQKEASLHILKIIVPDLVT